MIPTFEDWLESLSEQELQEAYMLGGSDDDNGLIMAYHIQMSEVAEFKREEQREMEWFDNEKS